MQTQKDSKQVRIKTVYIHLTHACNLRCKYCYFDSNRAEENELSLEELGFLFEDIVALSAQRVVFTGGEPLLRPDLFEIADAFWKADPKKQVRLCLISNGSLIGEKEADSIAKLFDEVRVSVDGSREVNDKLRGDGAFDGAMKAIDSLKNAGIFPSVSITITNANVDCLSEFLSFLLREKVAVAFNLVPFRPVGRGAYHKELEFPLHKARLAIVDFWQSHFGASLGLMDRLVNSDLASCGRCGVGSYINIHSDGSVYPCHVLSVREFFLGNIRQTRLSTICQDSIILKNLCHLDFTTVKVKSAKLRRSLSSAVCLGEVYRCDPEELFRLLRG